MEKKEPLGPSMIKNKEKRSEVHAKLKHQKKLEKHAKAKARDAAMKRALELGEELPEKKVPRTIENTQELDETVCKPDDEEFCLCSPLSSQAAGNISKYASLDDINSTSFDPDQYMNILVKSFPPSINSSLLLRI